MTYLTDTHRSVKISKPRADTILQPSQDIHKELSKLDIHHVKCIVPTKGGIKQRRNQTCPLALAILSTLSFNLIQEQLIDNTRIRV